MKRKTKAPSLPHMDTITLDDGTTLGYNDVFKVPYQGRFLFRYVYVPDGSVCGYGPINTLNHGRQDAARRAFRPEDIRKDK